MNPAGYEVQFLGKFLSSFDTDDEITAYEKYTVVRYYYETEKYDRLMCGSDGIPKNVFQRVDVKNFAREARKKVASWKYKKDYCYLSHEEIAMWLDRFLEKYPKFG